MRRTRIACILALAAGLHAQGAPELGLDVNGQADAVVARGWPLLIRVAAISSDGQQVKLGLNSGAWSQALHLTITDQSGTVQNWPLQAVPPEASSPSLSGITNAEAVWLVAGTDTANIPEGTYNLAVTLDTSTGAAAGAWSGVVNSSGASVQLQAEAASLSAEEEASKYLAIEAYARLRGDTQGALAALDTLISRQPDILKAYTDKADLLAAAGNYADALALYNQALDKFLARNPGATEPLTSFTAPINDLSAELARQQAGANGGVTAVAPGLTATVFARDSVVTAYGAGLAAGAEVAPGPLSTTLGGTTVTLTDSAGTAAAAPLFYVSPTQVDLAAPGTMALGTATVTIRAADGSVHNGSATIVDIQPAVFTFNSAGLIAGSILRGQTSENLYTIGSGGIVAAPVDVSGGQATLVFYATGMRHAASSQITVSIGGVNLPVASVGAQPDYPGLDQASVALPASLAGSGDVPLIVTAAGRQSNTARITIK